MPFSMAPLSLTPTGPCFTNSDTDCQLIKQSTPEIRTTHYFNREKRWVRRNITEHAEPVRRSELQHFKTPLMITTTGWCPVKQKQEGPGEANVWVYHQSRAGCRRFRVCSLDSHTSRHYHQVLAFVVVVLAEARPSVHSDY